MIPVYNGKMTKAQMTGGASLPKKHCSNGLGMGRTVVDKNKKNG